MRSRLSWVEAVVLATAVVAAPAFTAWAGNPPSVTTETSTAAADDKSDDSSDKKAATGTSDAQKPAPGATAAKPKAKTAAAKTQRKGAAPSGKVAAAGAPVCAPKAPKGPVYTIEDIYSKPAPEPSSSASAGDRH